MQGRQFGRNFSARKIIYDLEYRNLECLVYRKQIQVCYPETKGKVKAAKLF